MNHGPYMLKMDQRDFSVGAPVRCQSAELKKTIEPASASITS